MKTMLIDPKLHGVDVLDRCSQSSVLTANYSRLNLGVATTPQNYTALIAGRPRRNIYFWILPVEVFGSSSMNVKRCGTLKCARASRVKSLNSASDTDASDLKTTNASGTSPQRS
jgi:hypothetical protein